MKNIFINAINGGRNAAVFLFFQNKIPSFSYLFFTLK